MLLLLQRLPLLQVFLLLRRLLRLQQLSPSPEHLLL